MSAQEGDNEVVAKLGLGHLRSLEHRTDDLVSGFDTSLLQQRAEVVDQKWSMNLRNLL